MTKHFLSALYLMLFFCFMGRLIAASEKSNSQKKSTESGSKISSFKEQPKDVKYFVGRLTKTKQPENSTEGLTSIQTNGANDYVVMGGEFDGYIVFKLFRGSSHNLLLKQLTGCGPECEQTAFEAFLFEKNDMVGSNDFETLYPKAQVSERTRIRKEALIAATKVKTWIPWLRISSDGNFVQVLLLDSRPGGDNLKIRTAEVGRLVWSESKFKFELPRTTKIVVLPSDAIR